MSAGVVFLYMIVLGVGSVGVKRVVVVGQINKRVTHSPTRFSNLTTPVQQRHVVAFCFRLIFIFITTTLTSLNKSTFCPPSTSLLGLLHPPSNPQAFAFPSWHSSHLTIVLLVDLTNSSHKWLSSSNTTSTKNTLLSRQQGLTAIRLLVNGLMTNYMEISLLRKHQSHANSCSFHFTFNCVSESEQVFLVLQRCFMRANPRHFPWRTNYLALRYVRTHSQATHTRRSITENIGQCMGK